MKDKFKRFSENNIIICPHCSSILKFKDRSLICENKHCFDVAKQGYVNLLLNSKKFENYDKFSFENRHTVLESGLYDNILNFIIDYINQFTNSKNILDVACGEGYYSKKISDSLDRNIYAFDISKDSIIIAARSDKNKLVKWFVSDLANIAVKDSSFDFTLDIFSPANYEEFKRILKSDGSLIKVIPGENHLFEIREKVKDKLENSHYSNKAVVDCFSDSFDIIHRESISYKFEVTNELLMAIINMTPLLFNIDSSKIDWSDISEITIHAEVLIGKK